MTQPTLTLRSIRARAVVVPLKRPIVARIATIPEWPLVLVDLETEEGITGRAYAGSYTRNALRGLLPLIRDFGPLMKGSKVAPVELYERARKSLHFAGYQGLTMIAASALDMAAWDALAKAAGVPLCVLLGGSAGPVKAYNSNGLWLSDPNALADEAIALRDEGGYSGVKMRLGRADPRDDVRAIETVRKAIGERMHLMVDYNQALDMADARLRLHMIDGMGLGWIEEPILYDNFDGCAQLADELDTPIQIGENFYGPRDLHMALRMKACDLVMPDYMRIGGVTGWMRAAGIAGAAGIPMSTHLFPEVGAHTMRVTESAHWLEMVNWADPVLQRPYAVKEGMIQIPDAPGLAMEWNEDAVKRYGVDL